MQPKFANVIGAFSEGLKNTGSSWTVTADRAAPAASLGETSSALTYYRALAVLAEQAEGRMPFSQFGSYLPGDAVGTLSSALRLMKEGWVEFVGDISETSDVRITPLGRDTVDTLKRAISAP